MTGSSGKRREPGRGPIRCRGHEDRDHDEGEDVGHPARPGAQRTPVGQEERADHQARQAQGHRDRAAVEIAHEGRRDGQPADHGERKTARAELRGGARHDL